MFENSLNFHINKNQYFFDNNESFGFGEILTMLPDIDEGHLNKMQDAIETSDMSLNFDDPNLIYTLDNWLHDNISRFIKSKIYVLFISEFMKKIEISINKINGKDKLNASETPFEMIKNVNKSILDEAKIADTVLRLLNNNNSNNLEIEFAKLRCPKNKIVSNFKIIDGSYQLYFEIKDFYSIILFELSNIRNNNVNIKECENCFKYFIVRDSAEKYCSRISPIKIADRNNLEDEDDEDIRTCREVGYLLKVKFDPIFRLYNKTYKTKHAQKQRQVKNQGEQNIDEVKIKLDIWRKELKAKRDEYQLMYERTDDEAEKEIIIKEFKSLLNREIPIDGNV